MRFKILRGSQTGHCCFEFTVVDTAQRYEYPKEYHHICETFEEAEAIQICKALNGGELYEFIEPAE